jgi:hypothetical protein
MDGGCSHLHRRRASSPPSGPRLVDVDSARHTALTHRGTRKQGKGGEHTQHVHRATAGREGTYLLRRQPSLRPRTDRLDDEDNAHRAALQHESTVRR